VSGPTKLPSGLVTFMFTDIEGSTRLARLLGDSYGAVLNAHRSVLRTALRDYGGHELFTEGDSFFVAFGDAAAAVAACVAAQRALAGHPWPSPDVAPRVRMGLHTGWAQPVAGEYTSAEVHRAARVASAAHGGQVLCSEATALAATTWSPELTPSGSAASGRRAAGYAGGGKGLGGVAMHEDGARRGDEQLDPGAVLAEVDLLDLGPHRLRGFDDAARLFQLVAPGLERDFPRVRTPGAPVHNLPAPVTELVGRRAEVVELTRLVGRHRLVTVAGAGGSGKTRVALAAAAELLTAYPDGVWLVDAATGGSDLVALIAGALGLRPEPGRPLLETVVEQCAARRVLLVFDTCEAVAAAEVVRRLLAACPRLDILAAGREPLGVHGEVVWRIPPLAPADAFTLLSERAAAARGGRAARPEETADLARVAARLEGVPLAIELAAARLQLLSAAQLASRLDDPLTALGSSTESPRRVHTALHRHDSLADNLEWSYRRLSPAASRLLRRLAVFAGPVELSTVEWCGRDALGALSELTRKSMTDVVPGPRYKISEQVRAFAVRRLAAAGEEAAARDRHAAWALHILDQVAVDTDGQPRTVSLTELAPFVGEWQTALHWAASGGDVRAGFRLAGALDPWWREQGGARTGRDLLEWLYGRAGGAGIEPAELASAHLVHAGLADDRAERGRFLERAAELARQADRPDLLIRARAGHRVLLLEEKKHAEAEQLCRQVIAEAERAGVPIAALPSVLALAELLWRRGALDEAADLLGGARQLEAARPEDRGRRTVDWLLGMVALRRGDLIAAHDHLVVALRSRLRHGFRGAAADAVAAIAVRCALGGDTASAAVLFGGAESVRGPRRTMVFGAFWAAQQAALQASLGDKTFDAAYVDGADLGFDQIVAMALAVEHPDLEHGSVRFAPTLN
jgi:predicted ATPase/class 3 adenylate cyclase